jgi:UDP-N-acetylmuramoyl-tripeptide--D-alanyl-D-alanine ligase
MMPLSQAAQALGGKLIGPDVEFAAVSSDSRRITAGDLFIALKGENFDGAKFIEAAARSGAVAALMNAASYQGGEAPCSLLLVEDTRLALGSLAAYWRSQFDIPVVALTGSNGKTTVKEMLASILREATGDADSVLATQGNLNNDIGMPQTLLMLRKTHRFAVIEMGMNHPGEIEYLSRICRPDVAVITNAASAHLAGLGTVEAVARAKGEIFSGLKEKGIAVINADDAYAQLWRDSAQPHRIIEFGLDAAAATRYREAADRGSSRLAPPPAQDAFAHRVGGAAAVSACWDVTEFGIQMEIAAPAGSAAVKLQVPGAHNARNALAAAAAALALDIPLPTIVEGLEKFAGVAGRLQRMAGHCGATVIDDTYNANPASMRAALQVLAQAQGRRIFVMGDMGELGANELEFHAEIGAAARQLGIQRMLALGELSRAAVNAFGAGAQHFDDVESLIAALDKELAAGVTVLVKGSRFMKMERVVRRCTQSEEACCSH